MTALLYAANAIFGVFVEGTYPIRPILFIGYILLLVLAARFLRKQSTVKRHQQWLRAAALGSAALLFIGGIAFQIAVFHAHAIPHNVLAASMDSSEVTSTRLTHIHFNKVAIGATLARAFPGLIAVADTGEALVAFVPRWYPYAVLLLFLLALASALLGYALIEPPPRGSRRVALLALYGLASFIVLEKSIDGGLFSDSAFLALGAYAALLYLPPRAFPKAIAAAALIDAWVAAGLYRAHAYASQLYLLDFAQRMLLFLLVAYALHALAYGKKSGLRAALAAVTMVLVLCAASINAGSVFTYRRTVLATDNSLIVSYAPLPAETELDSLGTLGIYKPRAAAGKTIGAVLDSYHLPEAYHPIAQTTLDCTATSVSETLRFSVLTPAPLSATALDHPLLRLLLTASGRDPAGWYRYDAVLVMDPCLTEDFDLLHESLRALGAARAIIYGPAFDLPSTGLDR